MPKFQVFTKRLVPLGQAPYVTVQRKGVLSLNASASMLLGDPKTVELMYDPDERIIGVRAVDATVEHAYPVRQTGGKQSTYLISGTAFAKYFGIGAQVATRYPAYMEDDILCVDLKSGGTDVTGPRAAARAESGDQPAET